MSKLTPSQYVKHIAKRENIRLRPMYNEYGLKVGHQADTIANELMPHATVANPLTPKRTSEYFNSLKPKQS